MSAPIDPALIANLDPRLDASSYNLVLGTAARDKIRGTWGDDYIVAGAGNDYYVAGGSGRDVFEVNRGDDVVRVADFHFGFDLIALEDEGVLRGATLRHDAARDRLDVRFSDGTLLRIDDLGIEEFEASVVFRHVAPEDAWVEPAVVVDDGLTANDDARLDRAALNVIEGTDGRDDIAGTSGDDYVAPLSGGDLYVRGGAGRDTFEVGYGDGLVRIADFAAGEDAVALADETVLAGATIREDAARGRLDVELADGTLLRIDDLSAEDFADAVVFRHVEAPAPLKIVVWGGQSLAVGAQGTDWVSTEAVHGNSLMMAYDEPRHGSRGWEGRPVDAATFQGFAPRVETAKETPASGGMNYLAERNPDTTFLSLHYGTGGKDLAHISTHSFPNLVAQLQLACDHARVAGHEVDPVIEIAWIHGQSDSNNGNYAAELSAHLDEIQAAVEEVFGADHAARMFASITRGYGGKTVVREQFEAVRTDPDIHLGGAEVLFNASHPAEGDIGNPHLAGQGYYLLGTQVGTKIGAAMDGAPLAPIAIEAVTQVEPGRLLVDFSGVTGALASDGGPFVPENGFIKPPDHFGFDVYTARNHSERGEILASRIVDADTIEFVYSKPLSGDFILWAGRSDQADWIGDPESPGGRNYGGTTLYDDGLRHQPATSHGPLDPDGFGAGGFWEYVPAQPFEFSV